MPVDAVITQYSSRDWVVDFSTGAISEPQTNLNSIAQAIRFALETERYKYPIMGNNYGINFIDLVGADFDFIQSEVKARVKDALSIDDRIISVDNFEFERNENNVIINFVVKTIAGDINASTTIIA